MNILLEADRLVNGDRGAAYGHPLDNHSTTGDLFHEFLRRKYGRTCPSITAEDVCIFNMLQKIARLANTPDHLDSLVDIAGYAANYQMILDKRKETK